MYKSREMVQFNHINKITQVKKSAEILQIFCSQHCAEFGRKNRQQNFCKISVEGKIYADCRSFLEFPKISVQIRICAELSKNVCRKHNFCRLSLNKTKTGIRIYII